MSAAQARGHFAEILNHAAYGKARVLITRRNRPLAAVVPLDDIEMLEKIEDAGELRAVRNARKEARREGTISWERLKAELGLE
jgi:prevent-host-death family protein